mgnify:CR=1 FL=1
MAQLQRISRPLSQQAPFVANAAQPVSNPVSRGFETTQRIDALVIQLDLEIAIAGAPGTATFASRAEFDGMLNAAMQNIRFFSSTCGEMIRNLNLAQLVKVVHYTTGEFPTFQGIHGVGSLMTTGLGALPAGSLGAKIEVRVPFSLVKHSSIRAAFAPRVMQMQDGGFGYTSGTGAGFTIGGAAGTITAAASRINVFISGPRNSPVAKASPLLYEANVYNANQGLELPAGLYLSCVQNTDSADTAWGAAGGLAAGWRLFADGNEYVGMNDTDPLNAVDFATRGLGGAESWLVTGGYDQLTNQTVYDVVGIPVISTPYTDRSWDFFQANDRVVIDTGTNWTAAQTFLSARVIPTNQVPDVAQCPCNGGATAIPTGLPGEGSATAAQVMPYAPQRAK